jgi:hypothetical protein
MAYLVALATFVQIFFIAFHFTKQKREAFLMALLAWSAVHVVFIEGLSLFQNLHFWGLLMAWSVLFLGQSLFILHQKISIKFSLPSVSNLPFLEKISLTIITVLVSLTTANALLYPPNSNDTLRYHFPRILFWIQQRSVANYATPDNHQTIMPPLAEYLNLTNFILFGTDKLANCVQLLFYFACIVAASLIAKLLKMSNKAQMIAAFLAATIPMCVAQAPSSLNDLVLAGFAIYFFYFALKNSYFSEKNYNLIWASLALACAILTKGIAYIIVFPFVLYSIFQEIKNVKMGVSSLQNLLKRGFLFALFPLILNASFYARNYELYGNLVGNHQEIENLVVNQNHSWQAFISNVSRDLAVHFNVPVFSVLAEKTVKGLHGLLGISPNYDNTMGNFKVHNIKISEGSVSDFVHLVLLFCAIFYLSKNKIWEKKWKVIAYTVLISFCTLSFYLKYQPWIGRFHLTYFLLFCPFIALHLCHIATKYTKIFWFCFSILAAPAVLLALFNQLHPLISFPPVTHTLSVSDDEYRKRFNDGSLKWLKPFEEVNTFIQKQENVQIGLLNFTGGYDYYNLLLYDFDTKNIQYHYLNVENQSKVLEKSYGLDFIIAFDNPNEKIIYASSVFENANITSKDNVIKVYKKQITTPILPY